VRILKRLITLLICLVLLCSLAVPAGAYSVVLSTQKLQIDGQAVDCMAYNIDGHNYFRLRDLAGLLSDTSCRFSVDWSEARKTIVIGTGAYYDASGDASLSRRDLSATAVRSSQRLEIDGESVTGLSVFNIGGNNFFQLAELKGYLGYALGYDETSRTMLLYTDGTNATMTAAVGVYASSDDSRRRVSYDSAFSPASLGADEYAAFSFLVKNISSYDISLSSAAVCADGEELVRWGAFTIKSDATVDLHAFREAMAGLQPGLHTAQLYIDGSLMHERSFTLGRDWSRVMSLPTASQQAALRTDRRSPYIVCTPYFEGVAGSTEYAVDFIVDEAPKGTYFCAYDWDMDLSDLRQSYNAVWRAYEGTAAYAGFQVHDDGSHHAIFSVWDTYCQDASGRVTTIRAKQVYPSGEAKPFDGEGYGVQCIIPCDWQEGHSYRMLLQQSRSAGTGNVLMAMWLCDLETMQWTKLIEYDLGVRDTWITQGGAFLENYLSEYAGALRTMELSNFRARDKDSGSWVAADRAVFCQNYGYPGSYNYGSDGRTFWAITTGLAGRCALPPDQQAYYVGEYETGSPY